VSVFRNRRFLALWTGNAFSLVGTAGVRIAYPLLMLTVSDSPALAGWVASALTLPSLLFQVPAGIAADALNRRQIMLLSQVAGFLAAGSVVAALLAGTPHLAAVLVAAAFVEGSAFVFFSIAEVGAVRDVVDEEQRAAAFSFLEAEPPVANLAGRAFGGALFGVARWIPFLFNTASYVFSFVVLVFMPRRLFDPRPSPGSGFGFWRRTGEGFAWTWRVPFLRLATVSAGVTNLLFQCVILLVLVVGARDHRPAWVVGLILAAAGVGGLLASFAGPWIDRHGSPRTVFLGCLGSWTLCLLLIALSKNSIVLAVAWAGVGATGAISSIILTMARIRAVPDAAIGKVVGAAAVVAEGAVPLGAVAAGYFLAAAGPDRSAWALFAIMAALTLFCVRFLRPLHHVENTAVAPSPGHGTERDR
jgi:MFS family permease